ncbi:hypothetical protein M427DRAFT_51165 [Gonapodya prolifera JEL478]|uniref:SH3 domain-containing protein n=1 Tax=Gonapodya prolifera (strain JEL478) TaxID=1344416 RepID=A0A139AYJ8_GONPJ|nr:hypothetical protein M427DRAFT_51165 [Gonapodya prolifera JEL478]|eukprot:KXS21784.1 hypothetical protein M427DRAFT_51165 [Gonapodya prolifera JEL478]
MLKPSRTFGIVFLLILGSFSRAAIPFTGNSSTAECAVIEGLYDRSGKQLPWPRGSCCLELAASPTQTPSISCDIDGHILGIQMNGQGLSSAFPSFAVMSNLYYLGLSNNQLSGTFPNGAFSANGLGTLDVRQNMLNGQFPDLSGVAISALYLSGNSLTGNVDGRLPQGMGACMIGGNPGLYTCANNYPTNLCGTLPTGCTSAASSGANVPTAAITGTMTLPSVASASSTLVLPTTSLGVTTTVSNQNQVTTNRVTETDAISVSFLGPSSKPTSGTQSLRTSMTTFAGSPPGATSPALVNDSPQTSQAAIWGVTAAILFGILVLGFSGWLWLRKRRIRGGTSAPDFVSRNTSDDENGKPDVASGGHSSKISNFSGTVRLESFEWRKMRSGLQTQTLLDKLSEQPLQTSVSPHWTFTLFAGAKPAKRVDLPEPHPEYIVGRDYVARSQDELTVCSGARVIVTSAYRDGFGVVKEVESDKVGLIPLEFLDLSVDNPEPTVREQLFWPRGLPLPSGFGFRNPFGADFLDLKRFRPPQPRRGIMYSDVSDRNALSSLEANAGSYELDDHEHMLNSSTLVTVGSGTRIASADAHRPDNALRNKYPSSLETVAGSFPLSADGSASPNQSVTATVGSSQNQKAWSQGVGRNCRGNPSSRNLEETPNSRVHSRAHLGTHGMDFQCKSPQWTFEFLSREQSSQSFSEPYPEYVFRRDYIARNDDELTVTANSRLRIISVFSNGWGLARKVGSEEEEGLVPLQYLHFGSEASTSVTFTDVATAGSSAQGSITMTYDSRFQSLAVEPPESR